MARRTTFARGSGLENPRSINTIITSYKEFAGVVESRAQKILQEVADFVLLAAKLKTPKDTMALTNSGRARVIRTSKGPAASISFGGPDAPVAPTKNAPFGIVDYAVLVHEDKEGWSNGKYKSGEFKFLEKAAIETKSMVDAHIRTELSKIRPRKKR